jgi:hypothetical protein
MPKVKDKQFPPVKVTEEFLTETKRCAEKADEYLSDYIRKAVDMRNLQYGGFGYIKDGKITARGIENLPCVAAEPIQPMDLVAEKNGKAVKASKIEETLSKKPKYPKNTGYCTPIPK